MTSRFKRGLLATAIAAMLAGLGMQGAALANNGAADNTASNSAPANNNPADSGHYRPRLRMHPMTPPPGYYPPQGSPYYYPPNQPPAWGYRSPFDDPWFHQYGQRDWDPFAEIERMQREMDQLIQDTFARFGVDRDFAHMHNVITPGLDLRDEGDHYVAVVDIPGADKDAINIKLDERRLSISAEQHQENKRTDDKGNVIFQERRSGMFKRMVMLPEPVSASGMKSEYKDGVLTITIPKQKPDKNG